MGLKTAFEERVDKTDDCWIWTGGRSGNGYGVLYHDGERYMAHRHSLVLDGRDPGDRWALHTCDTPECVNPAHLYVGTRADNASDASERVEWPSYNVGEESGNAKLTEAEVRKIRERYAAEDVTQQELADEYGVSQMNVSRVVRGEYWSHVS